MLLIARTIGFAIRQDLRIFQNLGGLRKFY